MSRFAGSFNALTPSLAQRTPPRRIWKRQIRQAALLHLSAQRLLHALFAGRLGRSVEFLLLRSAHRVMSPRYS